LERSQDRVDHLPARLDIGRLSDRR
jgi:hypothetical protein